MIVTQEWSNRISEAGFLAFSLGRSFQILPTALGVKVYQSAAVGRQEAPDPDRPKPMKIKAK